MGFRPTTLTSDDWVARFICLSIRPSDLYPIPSSVPLNHVILSAFRTIITVYLPQIMERMEHVLDLTYKQLVESRKKLVLEQVITSIASVADAAQDHFVQFYERLMPPLKFILQASSWSENVSTDFGGGFRYRN